MARASRYKTEKIRILGLVDAAAQAHGRSPSVRDLAMAADVGVATMHSYLHKLAAEGLIEWAPGRHRSLRLTAAGADAVAAVA